MNVSVPPSVLYLNSSTRSHGCPIAHCNTTPCCRTSTSNHPNTPLLLSAARISPNLKFPRRHGCPDVCITVINNMYGYNAMEVQEAFVKIKEQARAYLALPLDLRAGATKGCMCLAAHYV